MYTARAPYCYTVAIHEGFNMAILDTFTSIFTADTAELKKGHDSARKSTDELVDKMKEAEKQSKKTNESLISLAKKAAGFMAATFAANASISAIASEAAEVSRLDDFADSIDTGIEKVDAFGKAMQSLGGSKSAAENALKSIYTEAKKSGENVTDATDALLRLSNKVQGMDPGKAKEYLASVGLSDRTVVDAMLKGRQNLEALIRKQQEAGVTSKETAEKAQAYNAAMGRMSAGMDRLKSTIASAFLPALTWVVDKFGVMIDWANENRNVLIGAFAAIAGIITYLYLPAMISAAAATLAATWPILLIGAAIAAFVAAVALAYDDIVTYLEGGASVTGRVFKYMRGVWETAKQWLSAAAEYIAGVIRKMVETVLQWLGFSSEESSAIVDAMAELLIAGFVMMKDAVLAAVDVLLSGLRSAFGLVKGVLDDPLGSFKAFGDSVVGIFSWMWDKIRQYLGFIFDGINKVKGAWDWVKDKAGFGDGDIKVANEMMASASSNPLNSTTSNVISNSHMARNEQNVQIGEIKVTTQATDAKGVASGIGNELQDQISNLSHETSTGIAR